MEQQVINSILEIPEKENSNIYQTSNSSFSGITKISESIQNTIPFITANREELCLPYLRRNYAVSVFTKVDDITISQSDFIETVFSVIQKIFPNKVYDEPEIKGRIPEAIDKNVKNLQDH